MDSQKHDLQNRIFQNSGPVIRYLMVNEMHYEPTEKIKQEELLKEVENHPTVKKWLDLFGKGPFHGSTNNAVENVFGRLLEFGFKPGDAALDERVLPYINNNIRNTGTARLLLPFLVRAGYAYLPEVQHILTDRLYALDNGCSGLPTEIYLTADETDEIPKAWKNRPVFRPEKNPCGIVSAIPWIYDLHALSFCPDSIPDKDKLIKKILSFVMTKEFQAAPVKAVIWEKDKHTCFSCPILRLPGFFGFENPLFNPNTFIMILEALSNIPAAVDSEWMRNSMNHLETFQTQTGTYKFPSSYLPEKETYYLYWGGCMGLCENRKNRNSMEIESSFRMIRIKKNIDKAFSGI